MNFVNEELLSELECPICVEYMVAPITQCRNGHNICDTCKKKLYRCPSCSGEFLSRNRALEHLSETAYFPCENVDFGCLEGIQMSKKDQHARMCPYRLYDCFAGKKKGCEWRGRTKEVLAHVQEQHKEVAWMKGDKLSVVVQNVKLPKEVWDCQLLQAHNEVFWFYQHYNAVDEIVYSAVQYMGPVERAKKFTYTIAFSSQVNLEKVSMTCFTLVDLEGTELILTPENSAYVEFWKLNNLLNDGKVRFDLKIKKVK